MWNIHVPNAAIQNPSLSYLQQAIFISILRRMRGYGENVMKFEDILKDVGTTRRQNVTDAITKLENLALLKKERIGGTRGGQYRFFDIQPKDNFTKLEEINFERLREEHELLVNYVRLKNVMWRFNYDKSVKHDDELAVCARWMNMEVGSFHKLLVELQKREVISFNTTLTISIKDGEVEPIEVTETEEVTNEVSEPVKSERKPRTKKQDEPKVDEEGKLKPYDLMMQYYNSIGMSQPKNQAAELKQISLLIKKELTQADFDYTFAYMRETGKTDTLGIARAADEALKVKAYASEINKAGTLPNLIKRYYDGLGLEKPNKSEMFKRVNKLNSIIATGKTYKDLLLTIDYMIQKKETNFNFITNRMEEALASKSILAHNPSFNDQLQAEPVIDKQKLLKEKEMLERGLAAPDLTSERRNIGERKLAKINKQLAQLN